MFGNGNLSALSWVGVPGLLREVFLEQGFGSLYALLRQQDGFGLAPRIFNVAALMQAI